jgi:hypothetical protein
MQGQRTPEKDRRMIPLWRKATNKDIRHRYAEVLDEAHG